jgi:hypothetical protein
VLAIMQPYFLPYLGYLALLARSRHLVLLDSVQYIRHGWVNRNRILHPADGWQYIQVPLVQHPRDARIRDVRVDSRQNWAERILGQLSHYKRRAPNYAQTAAFLADVFDGSSAETSIGGLNARLLTSTAAILGVEGHIQLVSRDELSFRPPVHAGDWALAICEALGAREYVNPVSGAALFREAEFRERGIELSFLQMDDVVYSQRRTRFEPWLSVVDVMMFVPWDEIAGLIGKHRLVQHAEALAVGTAPQSPPGSA